MRRLAAAASANSPSTRSRCTSRRAGDVEINRLGRYVVAPVRVDRYPGTWGIACLRARIPPIERRDRTPAGGRGRAHADPRAVAGSALARPRRPGAGRPGDDPLRRGAPRRYEPSIVGLDDVSVQIDKGEFVFLVGPSRSGKSTFIKLLLGDRADVGNLIVGGKSLRSSKRSKVPTLRRNIGCVFQDFELPRRTASSTRTSPTRSRCRASRAAEIRKKVPDIIGLVGLATERPLPARALGR